MKIDDIDAFVAVIRCQSISHAAHSLDLTQPAITRRVQNFEQAVGVELFDRNTKPLKPTQMGNQVYQRCLSILREIDALNALGWDASEQGIAALQGRICEPEEVARAALFLASDDARFVNGTALVVDNTWTAAS